MKEQTKTVWVVLVACTLSFVMMHFLVCSDGSALLKAAEEYTPMHDGEQSIDPCEAVSNSGLALIDFTDNATSGLVIYTPDTLIQIDDANGVSHTVGAIIGDGDHFELEDPNWLTDDSIRLLCSRGRVCKVIGHQWHAYPDVTMQMVLPDPYRQTRDISTLEIMAYIRQCVLCGSRESRNMTEWKKE